MVKLYKIEILHVHYAIPHAYAGYMAKQMLKDEGIEIPMVTTLHGTDIGWKSSLYKPAVSFSINKSDIVTSVSESLKEDTYKLFNIKKDIYVIPNFIELDKNIQDPDITCRRSVMAKENERIITHISNFREVKRIPDVIQIFYKIQQKVPAKLMMVGDGPEKKSRILVSRIRYFRQSNLFGNSNEIDQILSYTDLFCYHLKQKVLVWLH
jgi:N-acetyl-alpha-D-glucosaminyl L-malate synthase BshA